MKKINKKNGFTLFELLVTISIIAVMTAVAVMSYGGISKRSRDAKRMADLEKIRIALEAARQVGSSYPGGIGGTANLTGYLQQWPKDPKAGTFYPYSGAAYTYQICAFVEDVASTTTDITGCVGVPNGYAGYYKVVNP
jgi:prepilin-type N-terminal cleavage/methylation domain-containing protein